MRASWIFSRNDVLVNLGTIGGGALVALLRSRIPDLVIGLLVSVAVFRGGVRIVGDARDERRVAGSPHRDAVSRRGAPDRGTSPP